MRRWALNAIMHNASNLAFSPRRYDDKRVLGRLRGV